MSISFINPLSDIGESITLEFKEGHCLRCNKVLHRYRLDEHCQDCSQIIEQELKEKKKEEFLELRASLDISARLKEIESWIYDHQENHPRKEILFK